MNIKSYARRISNAIHLDSAKYVRQLRAQGVRIGDDCTIHFPKKTHVDLTAPHLITIGDHVNITGPATILTHDYSWAVIKGITGEILGNQKQVTIGNNVFIGWGATILCGTTIEDNVIVGAHSVVSGRLEHDSVYAGIPAKRICSLERYRSKRIEAQIEEAQDFAKRFHERNSRFPKAEEMYEYFFLWADPQHLNERYLAQMQNVGTFEKSMEIISTPRPFQSFEAFIASCQQEK